MAPSGRDESIKSRRKSLNPFTRHSLSNLSNINTNSGEEYAGIGDGDGETQKKEKRKLGKRHSVFSIGPAAHHEVGPNYDGSLSPSNSNGSHSPRVRPRTLQKGRPTSIFGSLGKRSMTYVDEEESDHFATSTPESTWEDGHPEGSTTPNKSVLYHGEVQTESGMFRKKKEYLVLTDTHLIRFKSQSRASESFPSIPHAYGRTGATRHPSTSSLHEVQSNHSHTSAEGESRISLSQIVTAYRVEDGRPFFTTEVVYLDEEYHGVGSIQLMLYDPTDADLWLSSIRGAAQKARLMQEEPFPTRIIKYLVRILEGLHDYDPHHFQVFRVVQRAPLAKGGKSSSSSDDLQKLAGTVFYMVIGINSIHLIPVPDFSDSSRRLLVPKANRHTHGTVTLYRINMLTGDDRFELAFRMPLQPVKMLELAAFASFDIVEVINRAWQYLKPLWVDRSFLLKGAGDQLPLEDVSQLAEAEEYGAFDRTLVAHCIAYGCNPTNVQYAVDWHVEDAPEFRLYPPALTPKYSVYELLAICRSLRYNNSFHSISFRDIDLHSMHGMMDDCGTDHVAYTSRNGLPVTQYSTINPQSRSILYREVQALALKSSSLRRVDFTNSLPKRRPTDMFDLEGREIEKDPGCEIVGALLPLCGKNLTSISWIILSGIELGETDLEEMIPALNERGSHIRAIECSHCGLTDRGIIQLLGHLEKQNATLECINIADNSGRIEPDRFSSSMSRFSQIRKLDLSRITRIYGDQPLFAPEVLLSWDLEEFIMNGIPINDKSLDAIATYLASGKSDSLRVLQMEQCNLNGNHVALLMRAMSREAGQARELQLHVNANKLEKGVGEIAKAIKENHTPSHLVMRMIEFEKEDHFRQILEALRTNTTIRSLDLSKASLPYDANEQTCDTLRLVFAENTTLTELDISGEQAHLEVTRFGIGLNYALTGLKENKALKVLRIEYQNLGMEGADTLSSVLEHNKHLTHIHCEHNDINLQGFTILVNALAQNYTVLEFPFMHNEQDASMKRISSNMLETRTQAQKIKDDHNKSTMRRSLSTFGIHKPMPAQDLTPQDVDAVVRLLAERWDTQMQRMAMFLERNRNIANGIEIGPIEGFPVSEEFLRPTTAMSDNGIFESVLSNTTPRADCPNPVDQHMNDRFGALGISTIDEGDGEENSNERHEKRPRPHPHRSMSFEENDDPGGKLPFVPGRSRGVDHLPTMELGNGEFFKME